MSRQSSQKSKGGDKLGSSSAKNTGASSAAGGVVIGNHDFIPNRFNISDWVNLIHEEEDTTFIGDVVDDIINKTLDKCEEVHRKKQLMPYTLEQTKNVLLQLIQWHFLAHDNGEQDNESWQEEQEPQPSVIDSWAQGSVPVIINKKEEPTHENTTKQDEKIKYDTSNESETSSKLLQSIDSTQLAMAKKASHSSGKSKKSSVKDKRSSTMSKSRATVSSSHSENEQKQQETSSPTNTGKYSTKKSQDTDQSQRHLQTVKSQKSGMKPRKEPEIVYDDDGYIIKLQKIQTNQLPEYQVNVAYRVVSQEHANPKEIHAANQLRRRGRNSIETSKRKKSILLRNLQEKYSTIDGLAPGRSEEVVELDSEDKVSETKLDPYTPTLIEAIEASPGVVIKEGNITKKGPSEEQQLLIGNQKDRFTRRRYLNVNIQDTTQLRLLSANSQLSGSLQRHSVLPAIRPRCGAKFDIQAS